VFARLLDDVCGGDEVGVRRLTGDVPITAGDDEPRSASDLLRLLGGGQWDKLIRSGRSVAARVQRDEGRCVVIGEVGRRGENRAALTRLRVFGEIA
jgi:hypothetical protein